LLRIKEEGEHLIRGGGRITIILFRQRRRERTPAFFRRGGEELWSFVGEKKIRTRFGNGERVKARSPPKGGMGGCKRSLRKKKKPKRVLREKKVEGMICKGKRRGGPPVWEGKGEGRTNCLPEKEKQRGVKEFFGGVVWKGRGKKEVFCKREGTGRGA